jgi:hypothetical protein
VVCRAPPSSNLSRTRPGRTCGSGIPCVCLVSVRNWRLLMRPPSWRIRRCIANPSGPPSHARRSRPMYDNNPYL